MGEYLSDLRGNFGERSVNFRMILRDNFTEILAIDLLRQHAMLDVATTCNILAIRLY